MKFKVGDRVRVKENSKYEEGRYAGTVRVIDDVVRRDRWPYESVYHIWFNGFGHYFHANELELIGGDK